MGKRNEGGVHTVYCVLDKLFAVCNCMKSMVALLKCVSIAIPTIVTMSNCIFHFIRSEKWLAT
jgi:hypothetical protein